MKPQTLLEVVKQIVEAAGMTQAFETEPEFHLKLEQASFEPLVIESWPAATRYFSETRHVSVAHYHSQNGDLIPDPDILMTGDQGFPIEITTAYGYQQIVSRRPGRANEPPNTVVNVAAKLDVSSFMNVWAKNLVDQGWIEVARQYKEQQQAKQQEKEASDSEKNL